MNNNGSAQLLGNYDKLEYIYTDNYINLNLAGNFPSLKCVYMPGGQLLLGTANKGFTSSSADIINENGSITVYTAKDVTLNDVNVLTVGRIAIRGRIAQEPANFNVDGTMFAATGIVIGDMIDNNEKKFSQIPVFFSQSGISVINCKFKLFQGSLLSRNGTMVFADSTIEVLHGFLFAQKGIDAQQFMAKEGVYIEGNGFNKHTGLSNELYKPSGTKLGTIEKLSSAVLPEKFAKISGTTEFKDQVTQTKIDGEYKSTSSIGVKENDENNLNKILSKYKEKNPECSYYNIDELTIEQVNEICKYYGQDSKGNKVELGKEVDKYPYEKLKLE